MTDRQGEAKAGLRGTGQMAGERPGGGAGARPPGGGRHLALPGALALCAWLAACGPPFCPEQYTFNAPVGNTLFGMGGGAIDEEMVNRHLRVAEGFSVRLYAQVPGAREVLPAPSGDLLVSAPTQDSVILLRRDADGDGRPDAVRTLPLELDRPNGIDLHQGWLYIAEGSAIGRVRFDVERGEISGAYEHVVTGLPNGGNHWRRTVRFGPDGYMYATIGSSCNVCFEDDERRATMLRFNPEGGDARIFARGLRNAADFAWRPGSGELFATDNGRDFLGDNYPPCELNQVVEGGDYGWPVANGARDPDPDLGAGHEERIAASLPPVFDFPAHNAPLGITFLASELQPGPYRGAALVGLHGSWNRTRKDGYKVVSLHWQASGDIRMQDFLTGFLEDEEVIGRPVDVGEGPGGEIYISDDYAGAIYLVTRN